MGFVVSTFVPAIYPGMENNCPDGFYNTTEKNFVATLAAAERARLLRPENAKELEQRWKAAAFGEHNINVCSNYDQFPERPLNRTVQDKTAYGLDLDHNGDGSSDGYTCPHASFVSPSGETGIDNQAYRAFGCSSGWRGPDGAAGEIADTSRNYLIRGEYKIVMLLRGVDNLAKDEDVEVILASSDDMPILDAQSNFVAGATFRITSNPRHRNAMRGRIDKGVLTTGPAAVVLSRPISTGGPRAKRAEFDFDRGRLRIRFLPDGTIKGLLGGYQPIFSLIHLQVNAGTDAALTLNLDCASEYNTLRVLADGGRDPKTGQCNRVSSAYEIAGVRAYVIDRPPRLPKTSAASQD